MEVNVPLDNSPNGIELSERGLPSIIDPALRRVWNNNSVEGGSYYLEPYAKHLRKIKNSIHTTKYTWWNFIFKNLYQQFYRFANFFFLVVAILTLIPGITNISPVTSVAPLIFVLGVTAVKELYEDWKRSRSDDEVNNRLALKLENGEWKEVIWKSFRVGDIVKVNNGQFFPADIVLLSSSYESGISYVQTANLDGETNLKIKQALKETASLTNFEGWGGIIECELPNSNLYTFDGRLYLSKSSSPLSLNNSQLLLRDCMLKNTDWVVGIVVFTGDDTKIRRNSRDPPFKRSSLEVSMNVGLNSLFIVMFVISILSALAGTLFENPKYWYLGLTQNTPTEAFVQFLTLFASYIILYSYMIPISLYVSIELVKLAQIFFMENDLRMYHAATDTPAKAKTSNLNEQLGQIDFIFSDKTGTLTRNEMELIRCSVGGKMFSLIDESDASTNVLSLDKFLEEVKVSDLAQEFLILLSLCHTVVPEMDKEKGLIYQASSPDEFALVSKAAELNYKFIKRTFNTIEIEIDGKALEYQILNIIEFTSHRKRMSIVCRTPDGKLRIYCKGADNMILPRLKTIDSTTEDNLADFASSGLRTLCCAYAELDPTWYADWDAKFQIANASIADRKQKIEEVGDLIEQNLTLVGVTAIEDKLQEGVPETIDLLRKANLNIWVLTGDKQETAINIGLSCRLLTNTEILRLSGEDGEEITPNGLQVEIEKTLNDVREEISSKPRQKYSIVVGGDILIYILKDNNEQLRSTFFDLALLCKSVVCCRVSPSQKSDIVAAVKKRIKGVRTLAIGDGANDVSMIQEAHVGVGIFGKEGMQAALSSDYAIAQFKFLSTLLLIHGRWSYKRTSKLILYSFYKNIALAMCLFWYSIFCQFSGQNFFDSYSLSGFNVLFTSLPPIFTAIFDQDVRARSVEANPQLYCEGQRNQAFSVRQLWIWIFIGLWNSLTVFFGSYWFFFYGNIRADGKVFGEWELASASFTILLLVVTIKNLFETKLITNYNAGVLIFSIAAWFVWAMIYTNVCYLNEAYSSCYGIMYLYATPSFWFALLLITILSILPEFLFHYVSRTYFPKPHHIVQELQFIQRKQRKKERKRQRKPLVQRQIKATPKTKLDEKGEIKDSRYTGYAFSEDENAVQALQKTIQTPKLKRKMIHEAPSHISLED